MWFSNTIFDIKMCFSKRWQNWWSSTPLPHDMVVESRENFRRKEGGGNWVKCHAAVWGADFSVAPGERNLPREELHWDNVWEASAASERDLQTAVYGHCWWILGILTMKHLTNNELCGSIHSCVQCTSEFSVWTSIFSPPARQKKRQNWVISSSPSLLPHPANFKTAKTKTKPETAKCLILVCYSNGEILQGHRIGLLFHFWCVEMSMQIASLLFCLFLLRVASMEKTAVLRCPKCVKCLLHNLRLTFIF